MNAENEWLHALPVNSQGRHMLTVEKARQLALLSPTSWCVGHYHCGYAIGKQTAYPEWDLYYIVNDDNEPLFFDNLDAAIDLGQKTGDDLLKIVASRVGACIRKAGNGESDSGVRPVASTEATPASNCGQCVATSARSKGIPRGR